MIVRPGVAEERASRLRLKHITISAKGEAKLSGRGTGISLEIETFPKRAQAKYWRSGRGTGISLEIETNYR